MKQVFYVPDRGEVVLLSFTGGTGRDRLGRYPVVVLSPQAYNGHVGLALVCPVVAEARGYPFEVALPEGLPVQGVILADQARSVDWRALRAEKLCELPSSAVDDTAGKLLALLGKDDRRP